MSEAPNQNISAKSSETKTKYPQLNPMWLSIFMDVLGYSLLIPVLPFLVVQFQGTPLILGLLLSMNALVSFISGPIWGGLSDRYGRKPIMLICQIGTMSGFLLLAFSSSLWMLFLSRILDGIFGGIFTIAKAVVGDVVKPKDRGKQMTNIGLIHTFANVIGPVIGAFLSAFGILGPGLLAVFLCILMIIQTWFYLTETAPFVIDSPKSIPESSIQKLNQKILDTQKSKGSSWALLKNKTLLYILTLYMFHCIAFFIYISSLALFASLKLELSVTQIGILYTVAGVFQLIVRLGIFPHLHQRAGDRYTLIVGLTTFILVFLSLSFVSSLIGLFFIMLGISFASVCARGILNGFLSRSVSSKDQGKAMGLSSSVDNFAQIIGPMIGGAILDGYNFLWFGLLPSLLSIIAFIMIFRRFEFEKELNPLMNINGFS